MQQVNDPTRCDHTRPKRTELDGTRVYRNRYVGFRDYKKSAEFTGKVRHGGGWVAFRAPLKVCKEGQ